MKAIHTTLQASILAAAVMAGVPAMAKQVDHADHGQHATSAVADTTDGEIRKVDQPSGQLPIKHGELKNRGMGAMTMVFRG